MRELSVVCLLFMYGWYPTSLIMEVDMFFPLQGHRMCSGKDKANWEELLVSMTGASISWFPRWKEGGAGVLCSCEGFPNVPLIEMRGCINYNLVLAIRQLGYPMRGAPSEENIVPFIARGFNEANTKIL